MWRGGKHVTEADSDAKTVAPKAGRCVLLRSKHVLHEVRPSKHERAALSVWFEAEEDYA